MICDLHVAPGVTIDSGVAESVEMGVEMVKVEWGKPPGLEKTYGR